MGIEPKFTRHIEDFCCEKCAELVSGNGYTNHCPKCLHSKHVDNNPGDRSNNCQGLMIPKGIKKKGSKISVVHVCLKCGQEKSNILSKNDCFEVAVSLPLKK